MVILHRYVKLPEGILMSNGARFRDHYIFKNVEKQWKHMELKLTVDYQQWVVELTISGIEPIFLGIYPWDDLPSNQPTLKRTTIIQLIADQF